MLRRLINTHQIGRQTTSRETVSAEKVDSCASFPVCKFKNSKQIGTMGKNIIASHKQVSEKMVMNITVLTL